MRESLLRQLWYDRGTCWRLDQSADPVLCVDPAVRVIARTVDKLTALARPLQKVMGTTSPMWVLIV